MSANYSNGPTYSVPAAPLVVGFTDNVSGNINYGGVSFNSNPVLTFNAALGDTISLSENGRIIGTIVVTSYPMSWTLPTLADGQHFLSLIETNAAGMSSPTYLSFTVDSAHSPLNAPAAPVFVDLIDHVLGNVGNGATLQDANPVLHFSAAAGETVEFFDNGKLIGSVVATGSTMSWTLPTLKDGTHTLSMVGMNSTGLASIQTNVSFMVDASHTATVAPAAPVVLGLADDVSGNVGNGGRVFESQPVLTFSATVGDTISLSENGRVIGTIVATSSPMSWTIPALADGYHSLSLVDTNAAGLASSATSVNLMVDVAHSPLNVPGTPVFLDLLDHASGNVGNGGTVHDANPVLQFNATVGDTVALYDNGRMIGTIVVTNATMSWTLPTLANGQHNLSLIESNATGRTSNPVSVSFTVDTGSVAPIAPAAPVFQGLLDHTMGNVGNGATVHDANPALQFSATVGDTVALYDNGMMIGTMLMTSSAMSWTLPTLANGQHNLSLIDTNAAGLSSNATRVSFTVDAAHAPVTPPAAPVILDLLDHTVGNVGNGATVHDATPALHFNAAVGDTVALYDNGKMIGTIVVTSATMSWTLPALADGQHSLSLTETNAAGLMSAPTNFSFTVDTGHPVTTAPAAPVFLGLLDEQLGNVGSGGTVVQAQPVLTFSAAVGDTVTVAEGGQVLGTVLVTSTTMSWTLPALANGGHYLSLTETSAAGRSSLPTYVSFTVDTTHSSLHPVAPVFVGLLDHSLGNVGNGATLHDANPTLTFSAAAGETFVLFDNGNDIGTITTTADTTSWTLPTLANGSHYLSLIEIDTAKNAYVGTAMSLSVAVDATPAPAPSLLSEQQHVAVGQHDVFVGSAANETIDLNVDPMQYFAQSAAHIQGGGGIDTLHLTGSHQVLDLTSLSGKTSAAKVSGVEVVDLGGHSNTLNISTADVLNLGEQNLFQQDGMQQMMVKGSNGDTVNLSAVHVAGVADASWDFHGTTNVGGTTYNVFEHSGAHAELLIQQQVQVLMH